MTQRMAPRQICRKDANCFIDYRIWTQTAELSPLLPRMNIRYRLRSPCWARMLVRRVERAKPTWRSGANMPSIAATLVIRERLLQRLPPHHELWRCHGEYAGGCLCDGWGERQASAQASYEVDFPPGVTPHCVKSHGACCMIWQYEGESPPIS